MQLFVTFFVLLFAASAAAAPSAESLYADVVQPVLKRQCLGCHGEGNTFGQLDLTTRAAAIEGGGRGAAIVPGEPEASLLLKAVEHAAGPELQMPPGGAVKKLDDETLAAIREWIVGGAPYAEGQSAINWDFEDEDLWAFRPVADVKPPTEGVDPARVRTPIDTFVLAKLAEKELTAAPPADKLTLLRRVTFDLTGLPPTPEEAETFLKDDSDGAYKKVVERLLASPAYGERWGRHWLDVTRYADTSGYSNDFERPNAWRYRDYVIRSFNQDKPYDRFVLEQIAGDELFPENPEAILATGFLRTGPWEHTGMAVAAVTRQLFLDDVTHHVGQSFLAMTLGCAKCHDHKFDPIPTRDYYRIQAAFATTAFARRPLEFLPSEATDGFDEGRERYKKLLAALDQRMENLHEIARAEYAKEVGPAQAARASSGVLQRRMSREQAETLKLFRKHVSLHKESAQRFEPYAYSVSSGLVEEWNDVGPAGAKSFLQKEDYESPESRILVGGDVQAPGEEVTPGVMEAVERYSDLGSPPIPETTAGRRSALAKWIADERNPLTARVMVNRIWQYHFGQAIAANANNFGKMGKKPTHPELLDWLAGFFVDQGWSVKAVHRVILYSNAYQRGGSYSEPEVLAEKDPSNSYLAVFSPRRLEAEELRDSMLAVAGELSDSAGGPGTYPQINSDVARQPRHAMGSLQPVYRSEPMRDRRNRRSIYSFQTRSLIDPMIEVFNGANPDLTCERRDSSTVPTQAFSLINSEASHEMALEAAERVLGEADDLDGRVEAAFRLAFGRAPSEDEQTLAKEHVERLQAHHEENPAAPRKDPRPIVHTITSELTGEQFRFTQPEEMADYEHNLHPSDATPEARAFADLALVLFNSNEFAYVY